MKTMRIMGIMGIMLALAGCEQKVDPKVKSLEERMVAVEKRADDWENLNARQAILLASNVMAMAEQDQKISQCIETLEGFTGISTKIMDRLEAVESNQARAGKSPLVYSQARTAPQMKDGVPIAIYNVIAEKAAAKWGSQFDMQEYEINKQVEAYRKLHGQ